MESRTKNRIIVVLSCLLVILTAIFTIASLIAVPWAVRDHVPGRHAVFRHAGFDAQTGLFRFCWSRRSNEEKVCQTLTNLQSWQEACQAMGILAAMCIISAIVLAPFYYCRIWSGCPLKHDLMTVIMIVLCGLTALFFIICLAVFNSKRDRFYYSYASDLGAAFGMGCLAAILAILAMILFIFIRVKNVRYG